MKYFPLYLLFAACLLSACDPAENNPPNFTNATRWIYQVDSFDVGGLLQSSRFDTVTISKTELSATTKTLTLSDKTVLTLQSTGPCYRLISVSTFDVDCSMYYHLACHVGDTLLQSRNVAMKLSDSVGTGRIYSVVTQKDVAITVPAGTFTCGAFALTLAYNQSPEAATLTWFVNDATGIVRLDDERYDKAARMTYVAVRKQLIKTE